MVTPVRQIDLSRVGQTRYNQHYATAVRGRCGNIHLPSSSNRQSTPRPNENRSRRSVGAVCGTEYDGANGSYQGSASQEAIDVGCSRPDLYAADRNSGPLLLATPAAVARYPSKAFRRIVLSRNFVELPTFFVKPNPGAFP